jgi:beta-1,4-mannosyltransferase
MTGNFMLHEPALVQANAPVIGSWPGRSFAWNSFPAQFCDAIEAAGCRVVDVEDPGSLKVHIDVLHIHWPEQIFWGGTSTARATFRTVQTLRALRQLHAKGVHIVWMVHNLEPHELSPGKALLWRWLSRSVARLADGFMTLSPATVPVVRARIKSLAGKPFAAAWHPAYPRHSGLPSRTHCRRELGIEHDQRLFVMPGLLRRYKGAEELINAFSATAPADARLLIAGKCDDDALALTLCDMASRDDRIMLAIERFGDDAFARLLVAADAVILPYRSYLHAGSIIHALSYARPVITPASPFATGLADALGTQWVRTFDGQIPAHAFDGTDLPTGAPDLHLLNPACMGEAAVRLYRMVLQASEGHRSINPALKSA